MVPAGPVVYFDFAGVSPILFAQTVSRINDHFAALTRRATSTKLLSIALCISVSMILLGPTVGLKALSSAAFFWTFFILGTLLFQLLPSNLSPPPPFLGRHKHLHAEYMIPHYFLRTGQLDWSRSLCPVIPTPKDKESSQVNRQHTGRSQCTAAVLSWLETEQVICPPSSLFYLDPKVYNGNSFFLIRLPAMQIQSLLLEYHFLSLSFSLRGSMG